MKILIIEDDQAVAETLQLLLSNYSYAVDIAADDQAGLQMAAALDYDLIVLDGALPKLEGVRLCQQVRAKGFRNPILLLLGQGGEHQKPIALNAGADDYMVKPFDAEELIARIQALLPQEGPNASHLLTPSYSSVLAEQVEQQPTMPQIAELAIVNEELRTTLEELHVVEEELRQQNEELEAARYTIEQEQRRYQDLFEFAPDGYLVTDLQGVIQEANRAAAALLEVNARYLRNKPLATFIAISDRRVFRTRLTNLDWQQNWEITLQSRQGDVFPVLITVTSILDAQNQITGLRWSLRDIRQRKQMEQQLQAAHDQLESRVEEQTAELVAANQSLRESEAEFRGMFNLTGAGMSQVDPKTRRFLRVNAAFCAITGYTEAELLALTVNDINHPDDRSVDQDCYINLLQGKNYQVEKRYLRKDGSTVWVLATGNVLRDAKGEPIRAFAMVQDISDRKQAEAALQESEQRLQTILDNSPAVIYLLDPQNKYLLVNRSYAKLLSTTPENLVGRSIDEFWPAEIADTFAANNRTVLQTKQLLQTEEVAPHPDGAHTYITVKFPLCDATGTPYALCGISTDITEKKQLEAQFYRSQRLESLGTLAGGIAHDLNNVLTPCLAISQLLCSRRPDLDERSQKLLKIVEKSAQRGAEMIQQILTFTRGTGGEQVQVQVAPLLQELLHVIQETFPRSISIRLIIPDQSPWFVAADSTYLHQVFMNLCVNARDAMPDGGTLTISVEPCFVDQALAQTNLDAQVGNYVVVTVADTGTGIPMDVRDRIFEPFFTTKTFGQGTGLGLATVLGIVRNYGGFLQVFTEVGQGTQMKVYLPTIEGMATSPSPPEEQLDGHGQLVLVVDDDVAVQFSTQSLLEDHHCQVLATQDAREAITLYSQHQDEIKLVILDIMMPNMDGLSLIQRLKAINPEVKIIAMSGLPANQTPALAVGASTFLSKPYTLQALLIAIQQLIGDR